VNVRISIGTSCWKKYVRIARSMTNVSARWSRHHSTLLERHVRVPSPTSARKPMEHLRFDHLFVYTATTFQYHYVD
jgi:hypothetical protein